VGGIIISSKIPLPSAAAKDEWPLNCGRFPRGRDSEKLEGMDPGILKTGSEERGGLNKESKDTSGDAPAGAFEKTPERSGRGSIGNVEGHYEKKGKRVQGGGQLDR